MRRIALRIILGIVLLISGSPEVMAEDMRAISAKVKEKKAGEEFEK